MTPKQKKVAALTALLCSQIKVENFFFLLILLLKNILIYIVILSGNKSSSHGREIKDDCLTGTALAIPGISFLVCYCYVTIRGFVYYSFSF